MDNAAVFIDGYNLYHGMCDAGLKPWLWVDLWKFARVLVPKAFHVSEVNYYTAPAKKSAASREHQGAFLEANRELNPDLNIVDGFMQEEDCCTCHKCQVTFRRWQEKRTDVNMAVDIATGALSNPLRFKLALVVTGDADQVAALNVVTGEGLDALVRFPPTRSSAHLTQAASAKAYEVTLSQLKKSQMPDSVYRIKAGRNVTRPAEWGERAGFVYQE